MADELRKLKAAKKQWIIIKIVIIGFQGFSLGFEGGKLEILASKEIALLIVLYLLYVIMILSKSVIKDEEIGKYSIKAMHCNQTPIACASSLQKRSTYNAWIKNTPD